MKLKNKENANAYKLMKPFAKGRQMFSSLNRYRKGFRILADETGSAGQACRILANLVSQEGLRSGKNLLRAKYTEYLLRKESAGIPESHVFTQGLFQRQQMEFTRDELLKQQAQFKHNPLISIIMPAYNTPAQWLARAVESLQEQIYPNWELCIVDDCSPDDGVRQLIGKLAEEDGRIRYCFSETNGGIAAASNIALEMAQGQFVSLVDHDDELPPDALFWVVKTIHDEADVEFIYSDECKIDDTDKRYLFDWVPKSDWSPEIMLNGMLTGHLTVYKTDAVRRVGGFRSEFDFSQDYDLALRMGRAAKKIVHIGRILYLWRSIPGSAAGGGKPYARISNVNALKNHLEQLVQVPVSVSALHHANCVELDIDQNRLVSIVIPSDSYDNLKEAIDGVLGKTAYARYEIVPVCNSPLADRLQAEYAGNGRLVFSRYDKPYNFSDKCNQGARDASGEYVVFYNDDVTPLTPDWLKKLVEYLYLPGVGGVSPKLLYSNSNEIQYAGLISGTPGLCGLAFNHCDRYGTDNYLTMHRYVRNVSILSGACCVVRKDIFEQVGGFDAVNTPDGHSDVILSYKLQQAGYRCVYTPYSVLYHAGNHSWSHKKGKYKGDIYCLKHWGAYLSEDPYFSDTMKEALYHDFDFRYKIYAKQVLPGQQYSGKDVLLIAAELADNPIGRALYDAAAAVKNGGGFPVVVCTHDGALREKLADAGIAVIVDESIGSGHFLFKAFARNFDIVMADGAASAAAVQDLSATEGLAVLWRLHAGDDLSALVWPQIDNMKAEIQILCADGEQAGRVPAAFVHRILPEGSVPAELLN